MDGPLGSPAQECLEFGEGVFDWVEVGTVRRQIEQRRSSSLDQRSDAWRLVARQVVHDDDVSRAHLRDENFLDVYLEGVAIDRTVEHERGDQAGEPQPGDEGGRLPVMGWTPPDGIRRAKVVVLRTTRGRRPWKWLAPSV